MLDLIQQRKTGVKIVMAVVLGVICLAMVITLVPGLIPGTTNAGTDANSVARVGDQQISRVDVTNTLNREVRGQNLPPMLKSLYAKQVVDQMVFEKALELEADRLGIRVTPQQETPNASKYFPRLSSGDTWMGNGSVRAGSAVAHRHVGAGIRGVRAHSSMMEEQVPLSC